MKNILPSLEKGKIVARMNAAPAITWQTEIFVSSDTQQISTAKKYGLEIVAV